MMRLLTHCVAALVLVPVLAWAAEPALEVDLNGSAQHYERAALLKRPEVRTVNVADDVSYHKAMHYRALPLSALLGRGKVKGEVQFTASDGFVANIPATLLEGAGDPWIAIEPSDKPWPPLKAGSASAGPFYLVWLAPQKGGVAQEQWPYQIAKIATKGQALTERFPEIVPKNLVAGSAEERGLKVYTANCSSCHTINGAGDANIGPDLNIPANPTEYFQEVWLRRLIREPGSVRTWKTRIMPGFSSKTLSDDDINDVVSYLKLMAKQR
ncbi:MAG TPA: cytochrome c [Burkholderiaceae bacterium]